MKTYTILEVADILSVSEASVRRLIKVNAFKASQIGRQWRIAEGDLKEYFERNSNMSKSKIKV